MYCHLESDTSTTIRVRMLGSRGNLNNSIPKRPIFKTSYEVSERGWKKSRGKLENDGFVINCTFGKPSFEGVGLFG